MLASASQNEQYISALFVHILFLYTFFMQYLDQSSFFI